MLPWPPRQRPTDAPSGGGRGTDGRASATCLGLRCQVVRGPRPARGASPARLPRRGRGPGGCGGPMCDRVRLVKEVEVVRAQPRKTRHNQRRTPRTPSPRQGRRAAAAPSRRRHSRAASSHSKPTACRTAGVFPAAGARRHDIGSCAASARLRKQCDAPESKRHLNRRGAVGGGRQGKPQGRARRLGGKARGRGRGRMGGRRGGRGELGGGGKRIRGRRRDSGAGAGRGGAVGPGRRPGDAGPAQGVKSSRESTDARQSRARSPGARGRGRHSWGRREGT